MSFVTGNTSVTVWRQNTNQVVQQDAHRAMYRRLVQYGTGRPLIGAVAYAGTGNGTIDDLDAGGVGGPAETWTIAFTDPTNFTVTGSVSGAQSAGTVGTNYTTSGDPITSLISFTITVGGVAFIAADAWTIPVTLNTLPSADRWVLDRWSPFTQSQAGSGGGTDTYAIINDSSTIGTTGALIWHGKGSGTDAIYAGILVSEVPASQQWNWRLLGYTGFSPTSNWTSQSGVSDFPIYTAHTNLDEEYWFVLNSRRYVVVHDALGSMHSMYQGFILPYATPAEWAYPMVIAGEGSGAYAFNSPGTRSHGIYFANSIGNGELRLPGGTWADFGPNDDVAAWPMINTDVLGSSQNVWDGHEALDSGDHFLFPICYVKSGIGSTDPLATEAYGVPEGCFMVTGTSQAAQTIITISAQDYLVVSNFSDSVRTSFWALRLL